MAPGRVQAVLIETQSHRSLACLSMRQPGESERITPRAPRRRWKTRSSRLPRYRIGVRGRDGGWRDRRRVPPVADYVKRIGRSADRYGVLLILDEVMCAWPHRHLAPASRTASRPT